MDPAVAQRLIELNKRFYQTQAQPFSATRGRLQPGVERILGSVSPAADILDLGCGNGNLAAQLAQRNHTGGYLGLDFSAELLKAAEQRLSGYNLPNFRFKVVDLSEDWASQLSGQRFDLVLAFAVMHHIPGQALRLDMLNKIHSLLAPEGRFIHSNWQFLNSPKLAARVQPWDAAGLRASQLDEGDHLLDWRSGEVALRYAHQFSEAELAALAEATGFRVIETFLSDGESGNLGLYSVWQVKTP